MAKNTGKVREFCQSRKVGTLSSETCTCLRAYNRSVLKFTQIQGTLYSYFCKVMHRNMTEKQSLGGF